MVCMRSFGWRGDGGGWGCAMTRARARALEHPTALRTSVCETVCMGV
jgi:hypothetical protein